MTGEDSLSPSSSLSVTIAATTAVSCTPPQLLQALIFGMSFTQSTPSMPLPPPQGPLVTATSHPIATSNCASAAVNKVNMMLTLMLASTSSVAGTILDLASGLNDRVRMLEALVTVQKTANRPVAWCQVLYVLVSASEQDTVMTEGGRVANAAEIQLDDSDEEEEDAGYV